MKRGLIMAATIVALLIVSTIARLYAGIDPANITVFGESPADRGFAFALASAAWWLFAVFVARLVADRFAPRDPT